MSLFQTIWLCVALVGGATFAAKLCVDGEVIDVFSLAAICIYIGWVLGMSA